MAHHLACGVLIGLCFLGTADDGTQMFNHLKFCIGVTTFFGYTQIMVPVLLCKYHFKQYWKCLYLYPNYYNYFHRSSRSQASEKRIF